MIITFANRHAIGNSRTDISRIFHGEFKPLFYCVFISHEVLVLSDGTPELCLGKWMRTNCTPHYLMRMWFESGREAQDHFNNHDYYADRYIFDY